jgi:hypothetical protein
MKWSKSEQLILKAYYNMIDDLRNEQGIAFPGHKRAIRDFSKFMSCGQTLTSPYGQEVYHWCRRPVCPNCSTYWGRKLGRRLVAATSNSTKSDYRMATLIWGIAKHPDDVFDLFHQKRRALGNAVDYRRRAKSLNQLPWRAFGLAGALEVDYFPGERFSELGTKKREQYRKLGFLPGTVGAQWVATTHALVHLGALGECAAQSVFESLTPVVHLQWLYDHQDLYEAADGVCGYSAKVRFQTTFATGHVEAWPMDVLQTYIDSVMRCSHGRQGFRLGINPKAKQTMQFACSNPKASEDILNIDPMPVLL